MASRIETNEPKIKINVSGFGPFYGIQDNPTSKLMKRLKAEKQQKERQCVLGKIDIFETSAAGSLQQLTQLRQLTDTKRKVQPHRRDLWVHFGVNGSSNQFSFEKLCWNEADFRCPDEQQWQPTKQPIDPTLSLSDCYKTGFPISLLLFHFSQFPWTVGLSENPGRFVCNWIYYQSCKLELENAISFKPTTTTTMTTMSESSNPKVLFVHVPPENVYSIDQQHAFAMALFHFISKLELEEAFVKSIWDQLTGQNSALNSWWIRFRNHMTEPQRFYHGMSHVFHLLQLSSQYRSSL